MSSAARAGCLLAVLALLTGCVQMPSEGPVVEPQVSDTIADVPGISFDPRPPQTGDSPADIVAGFLEAMKATPIRTTVARQFLSGEAADSWVPEQQIITYAELGTAVGETSVRIPLSEVNRYDDRGAWQRTQDTSVLGLGLALEDGEWRIEELPNALVVPESWFDDSYQRVSLYFFDPTAQVLVPEPVFVPSGEQFASSLVRGLAVQPDDTTPDVVQTYFPPGSAEGLAVPISSAGIATVALTGDPDAVDEETAQRMLAQLVWTLRQEPRIRAVELSIGGRALGGPSGSTQVNLDVGSAYDPNGVRPSAELFALDRGLLVSGAIGAFDPTAGPLGTVDLGVRSIGVDLTGARVAGVTDDGADLLVAPVQAAGEATRPVVGAVDLAAPSWDHRDRIWLLDRGAGRARVIVVVDGSAREVDAPGITGRPARSLLVSRDGSRLVAVVRGAKADRVVSTRVRQDAAGTVLGFTRVRTLPRPTESSPRIRDIGWRSPTAVSVLSDITEDLSEVRTISVDGAPGEVASGGTTRLRGPTRQLVSSPVDGSEVFALAGRAVTSLTRLERPVPDLARGLTSLTYVG